MRNQTQPTEVLLEKVVALCVEAGDAILEVYNQTAALEIETKADDSPVTAADIAAHKVLIRDLPDLIEGVPVLSEEGSLPEWQVREQWQRYWIIDPLDGTKEFINRNGEFTVNVALIDKGVPVLGVVYVPVQGVTYCGAQGLGAWKIASGEKRAIQTRTVGCLADNGQKFVVVASRRHGAEAVNNLIQRIEAVFGETDSRSMGSSLKLCLVAEGSADLYPRLAPTSEWDTAAAQAVVEAAGGAVYTDKLTVMRYNSKENILNPWFYVVGDQAVDWGALLK